MFSKMEIGVLDFEPVLLFVIFAVHTSYCTSINYSVKSVFMMVLMAHVFFWKPECNGVVVCNLSRFSVVFADN